MAGLWRSIRVDFFVMDDEENEQVNKWLRTECKGDFPDCPVFWIDEIEDKKNA